MQDRSGEAIVEMVDALTTNFTSFMREASHFDFLRRKIGPVLAKRNQARIWCAAAATGQEPYSILFTLLDTLGPDADVRVLATDISTKALASVASAVYSDSAVSGLPRGWLDRFFIKGNGRWAGWHRVKAELRARVECRRFNLLSSELPDKQFPAIFCRNVMIYFDRPTQELVIHRLVQRLEPGGYFFVGHSETANCARQELTYVMPAVYRKGDQWQSKR
jgi:chemotaxis protein methyltransferase CheR